eukprot:scaffold25638_cov99-Skeletonema_marinoi.AAC.1
MNKPFLCFTSTVGLILAGSSPPGISKPVLLGVVELAGGCNMVSMLAQSLDMNSVRITNNSCLPKVLLLGCGAAGCCNNDSRGL